jgi:hypothetical protein
MFVAIICAAVVLYRRSHKPQKPPPTASSGSITSLRSIDVALNVDESALMAASNVATALGESATSNRADVYISRDALYTEVSATVATEDPRHSVVEYLTLSSVTPSQ